MTHRNTDTPKRPLRSRATALVAGLGAMMIPATAQELTAEQLAHAQFLEDIGASQRIEYADRLVMLSQRIPAAACYYAHGIDTEASGAMLDEAADEFHKIINALEFGDESLGIIGAEERRKTLVGLHKLNEAWDVMYATADEIHHSGGTSEAIFDLAEKSVPVMDIASLLVSTISEEYANPVELLEADALILEISGRQEMLAQRISKDVCLLASGAHTEESMADLGSAAQLFEASLVAMINGMPEAGVKAPPNAAIREGLAVVMQDWTSVKPAVTAVLAGAPVSDELQATVFHGANTMTDDMSEVVHMYSEASKQRL